MRVALPVDVLETGRDLPPETGYCLLITCTSSLDKVLHRAAVRVFDDQPRGVGRRVRVAIQDLYDMRLGIGRRRSQSLQLRY